VSLVNTCSNLKHNRHTAKVVQIPDIVDWLILLKNKINVYDLLSLKNGKLIFNF